MKKIVPLLIAFLWASLTIVAQPYSIGLRTKTFTDPSRSNRSIATDIRYPATSTGTNTPFAAGQFPVVVFGHGFSMGIGAYTNVWEWLVPLGYVVVLVNTETGLSPSHDNFGKDLAFCAAGMQTENGTVGSPFLGKLTNKTAIMGHSMGGGCTVLAAANNTGITTIVGLAAAETNPSAAAAAANVSVPSLIVAGQNDCVTPQADHQIPIYNALNTCKYYAEIKNGIHCDFTNGVGNAPWDPAFNCYFGGTSCGNGNGSSANQTTQQARTQGAVTPWLNFWLKNDCAAWNTFTTALSNTANYSSYQQNCTSPLPIASVSAPVSICGGSTTLNAGGGTNYLWSNGQTSANITVSPVTNTTYTVTVYGASGCGSTTQTNVTIDTPIAAAGADQSICLGNTAILSASGGYSYVWNTGVTGQTLNVSPTVTTNYTVTVTNTTGCTASDAVVVAVAPCTTVLSATAWLQAPYLQALNKMDTTLRSLNLLPLSQPYNVAPWNYTGTEAAVSLPSNTTDWVLLEVRRSGDTSVVERRAALLLNNGAIRAHDNPANGVTFSTLAFNTPYFVSVRHRCHLPVLSKNTYLFNASGIMIDFSNPTQVEGGMAQMAMLPTAHALLAGDNDGNGQINISDFLQYVSHTATGINNYAVNRSDDDLNRVVNVRDYNFYAANVGRNALPLLRY